MVLSEMKPRQIDRLVEADWDKTVPSTSKQIWDMWLEQSNGAHKVELPAPTGVMKGYMETLLMRALKAQAKQGNRILPKDLGEYQMEITISLTSSKY